MSYSKVPYLLNLPSTTVLNLIANCSSSYRWCTRNPEREALPEYAGPMPFFVVPILRGTERSDMKPRKVHTTSLPIQPLSSHPQSGGNRIQAEPDQRQEDGQCSQGLKSDQHLGENASKQSFTLSFKRIQLFEKARNVNDDTIPDQSNTLFVHQTYSHRQKTVTDHLAKDSPLGSRWKAYFRDFPAGSGTTIVWPALLPPAHLAQTSISPDRISTSLPLPSSPHCDPRTTVTDKPISGFPALKQKVMYRS